MRRIIIVLLALMLCLTGCSRDTGRKNTVVYIPAGPRQQVQLVPDTVTVEATQGAPTPAETVPESTGAAKIKSTGTVKKNNSTNKDTVAGGSSQITATEAPSVSKPSISKPSGSQSATITIPAETKPPATEPPATEPPATEPPATESPATEPPATEPPATEPPAAEPPATEPPATEPPAAEPPATEPPAAEPPETEPPETKPPETEPPLYDISGYTVGNLEYAVLDRINEYRVEEGLGELSMDTYLCAIASCRSYEVSLVWSHTRPDGRSYITVLSDYGHWAGSAKELLAYGSGSGDGVAMTDKWMSSDSHRESLMSACSTVGIGVYRNNGFTYVTCLLVE